MSDEYSIDALEQDIAHLVNDIKARDVEIARMNEAMTTRLDRANQELAILRTETVAALAQADEEIARLMAENQALHLWAVAAYNQLVFANLATGHLFTTQTVLDSAPEDVWESSVGHSMTEYLEAPPQVQEVGE